MELIPALLSQLIFILFYTSSWDGYLCSPAWGCSIIPPHCWKTFSWPRCMLWDPKTRYVTLKSNIPSGRTRGTRSLGYLKHCRIPVHSQAPHIPPSRVISTTARHQIQPKHPSLAFSRRTLERHNPCNGWIDTIRGNSIHV